MDVGAFIYISVLCLVLLARPWYQPRCCYRQQDPCIQCGYISHLHCCSHKNDPWNRVEWMGIYHPQRYIWAGMVGLVLLFILYGLLEFLGGNVIAWSILTFIAILGIVPIVVAWNAPEYKHTVQALLQRVTQLSPYEDEVWKDLVLSIPFFIISACAALGYAWGTSKDNPNGGSDGAFVGASIGVLTVSLLVIYMLTEFRTETIIVWSQGLQNSTSSGLIPNPIAINPMNSNVDYQPQTLGQGSFRSQPTRLVPRILKTNGRTTNTTNSTNTTNTRAIQQHRNHARQVGLKRIAFSNQSATFPHRDSPHFPTSKERIRIEQLEE